MATWPDPATIDPAKNGWEYNTGIVLFGMSKVYEATHDRRYLDYIRRWVDGYVNDQGVLGWDQSRAHNLDYIQPGGLVLFLYEQTGLPKYKTAAETVRAAFDKIPRTPSGGFWHKGIHTDQMWIDGIYMGEPFLVRYGQLFGDAAFANDTAVFQATLVADHCLDPKTGLLYHAWDESRKAPWADPEDRPLVRHLGPRHGLVRHGAGGHPRAPAREPSRLPAPARPAEEERRRPGERAGPEDRPLVPGARPTVAEGQLARALVERHVHLRDPQGRAAEAR